jgi:uncharacterized protein (TIGR01777 family)
MNKSILVTGATGFVGRALVAALSARGDRVREISRSGASNWDNLPAEADAIVHLAGENVAQRWSAATKQRIIDSRVGGLKKLSRVKTSVLVSASAIGYYGDRGDELLDETATPGSDFLASVCVDWEKAALAAGAPRTVLLRFGLVVGKGGAMDRIVPPFRLGMGGRLGSGKQWMSWIQLDDLVAILLRAIDSPSMKGVYNAVSPGAVRNEEMTQEIAATLGVKARLPAPEFALKLAFGEMASMLLGGQHVVPERLESEGFSFRYPSVIEALRASIS